MAGASGLLPALWPTTDLVTFLPALAPRQCHPPCLDGASPYPRGPLLSLSKNPSPPTPLPASGARGDRFRTGPLPASGARGDRFGIGSYTLGFLPIILTLGVINKELAEFFSPADPNLVRAPSDGSSDLR